MIGPQNLARLKAGDPAAVAPDPTPALAAELAEELGAALALLAASDTRLRDIAVRKLEGLTNAEIAAVVGLSVPSVERKLARIRTLLAPGGTP